MNHRTLVIPIVTCLLTALLTGAPSVAASDDCSSQQAVVVTAYTCIMDDHEEDGNSENIPAHVMVMVGTPVGAADANIRVWETRGDASQDSLTSFSSVGIYGLPGFFIVGAAAQQMDDGANHSESRAFVDVFAFTLIGFGGTGTVTYEQVTTDGECTERLEVNIFFGVGVQEDVIGPQPCTAELPQPGDEFNVFPDWPETEDLPL